MKTLELRLKNNEEMIKVHLRLTCGGQRSLKEKFEEDTLSTLMGGINEIEKTVAVFDTALNYKDNDNVITDGEELYDLLVERGVANLNADGIAKVLTDIAVASGIIKKDQANSLLKSVKDTYDNVFDEIDKVMGDNNEKVKEIIETPRE